MGYLGNTYSGRRLGVIGIWKGYVNEPITPVLSNFRVEDAQPTRVLFDSSASISGMTKQGFTISGKTLDVGNELFVNGTSTTGHYFTVSSAFTFWDNNTIRLESGNGTVYDFTMEPIVNNIEEPAITGTVYYVDGNASGANNGTSEADAFNDLQAGLNAANSPGDVLYVKAGFTYNGGGVKYITSGNGTIDNPIRVIGYKTTINDISTNYYKPLIDKTQVSPALGNSEMPLITSGDANQPGFQINSSYYIVNNMQSYDSRFGFVVDAGKTNVIIDNCNAKDCAVAGNIVLYGNTTGVNYNATNVRVLNCVSVNGGTPSIANYGGYNLLKDNLIYSDLTGGAAIDYHISNYGNNHLVLDNECWTLTGGTAGVSGHGISFKAENFELTEYNLAKGNQVLTGTDRMFEMRNMGCQYNVCKDSYFEGITTSGVITGGGITIQTGAKYNIYERCHVTGTRYGIRMDGGTESGTDPLNNITEGNEYRNCIFENITTSGIYNSFQADRQHQFNDNIILHCVFDDINALMNGIAADFTYISFSGNEIIGSIINNITLENSNTSKPQLEEAFALDKCNFFGGFSQPAYATNSLSIDPSFAGFFVPTNESLKVASDSRVTTDYNGNVRNETTTTIGSVMLQSETSSGSTPVYVPDFYVSSSEGSDLNDGLTSSTPWASISKLKTEAEAGTISAGDVIAFKSGDTFNGTYDPSTHADGTSGNEIVYTSYGIGNKPIITCISEFNLTWTDQGSNIWTAPYSAFVKRMWMNGIELFVGQGISDVGVGTQRFWVDLPNTTFYLYSEVDPNNQVLEWSDNSNVLNIRADYVTIDGLELKGGLAEQIKLRDGQSNITIKNSTIGYGCAYSVVMSGCSNNLIENNTIDSGYTVDFTGVSGDSDIDDRGVKDAIAFWDGGVTSNVIIRNNLFKNWMHSGVHSNSTTPGETISNVSVYGNEFTAPDLQYSRAIDYSGYSSGFEVYNNYMHDYYGSNQLGGNNNHFHHNVIKNVQDSPLKDGDGGYGILITTYGIGTTGNIIENNLVWGTDQRGICLFNENRGTGEIKDNIIRNNIVIDGGRLVGDIGIAYHIDQVGESIYDNLFLNNSVYNSSTSNTIEIGFNNTPTTVAAFNATNADISGNIDGDPLVDTNYMLQAGSPCINAGVTPLSTVDYFGNSIPYQSTSPDIGVHESKL